MFLKYKHFSQNNNPYQYIVIDNHFTNYKLVVKSFFCIYGGVAILITTQIFLDIKLTPTFLQCKLKQKSKTQLKALVTRQKHCRLNFSQFSQINIFFSVWQISFLSELMRKRIAAVSMKQSAAQAIPQPHQNQK